MSLAQDLSSEIVAAVRAHDTSVVRVDGRRRRHPSSGIVVGDDLVVTTIRAVETEEDPEIGLPDGSTITARTIGRDPTTDLALLRTARGGLSPVAWHETESFAVGTLVLAALRPGRSLRGRLGILSAVGEAWRTPAGGRVEAYLESDIPTEPGFSGSLLVEAAGGRALGLNTAGLLRGCSTALPARTVKRVVAALVAHGTMRRGFLGIASYPVLLPPTLQKELGQKSALLVVSVEPETPAASAGLLLGDALVAADGKPVSRPADLLPLLEEERIGSAVTLRIVRAGELRDVRITVGQRAAAA
jgi:S1-C subfamily serine protease